MLEQMGDVVRKAEPSAVIRFRRHTGKSRAAAIGLALIAITYFAWAEVRRAHGEPLPFVFPLAIIMFFGRRLLQRWQTEIIRPRPQTREDRLAYRRLQIFSYAMALICLVPFLWFVWDPTDSPWHLLLAGAALLGFALMYVGSWILRGAYERLFDKIAATEGAYGF